MGGIRACIKCCLQVLLLTVASTSGSASSEDFLLVGCGSPSNLDSGLALFWPETGALEKLYIPNTGKVMAVVYDVVTETAFWFNDHPPICVMSSRLDGTAMRIVDSLAEPVYGMAIDPVGRRLFYAPYSNATEITVFHIDRQLRSTFHILASDVGIYSMDFDILTGHLYYSDGRTSKGVVRVSLDGLTSETFLSADKLENVRGITLSYNKATLLSASDSIHFVEQWTRNSTIRRKGWLHTSMGSIASNASHLFVSAHDDLYASPLSAAMEQTSVISPSSGCNPRMIYYVQHDEVVTEVVSPNSSEAPRETTSSQTTPIAGRAIPPEDGNWMQDNGLWLGCALAGAGLVGVAIAITICCVRKKRNAHPESDMGENLKHIPSESVSKKKNSLKEKGEKRPTTCTSYMYMYDDVQEFPYEYVNENEQLPPSKLNEDPMNTCKGLPNASIIPNQFYEPMTPDSAYGAPRSACSDYLEPTLGPEPDVDHYMEMGDGYTDLGFTKEMNPKTHSHLYQDLKV